MQATDELVDHWFKQSELDSAKVCIDDALEWARNQRWPTFESYLEMRLGSYWRRREELDSALAHYRNATLLRLEENDVAGAASGYNGQAIVYKNKGFYELALTQCLKAKTLLEKVSDSTRVAEAQLTLANLYLLIEDYPSGIEAIREGLTWGASSNPIFQSKAFKTLGALYYKADQPDSAQHWYLRSMAASEGSENLLALAGLHIDLGLVAIEMQEWDNAHEQFKVAQAISQRLESTSKLSKIYLNFGLLAIRQELADSALYYLNCADTITFSAVDRQILWTLRYEAYQLLGKSDSALWAYQKQDSIGRQLLNLSKANRIAELEEIYESEKKDRQLAIQDLELEQQQKEKQVLYLLLIAIVSILVGVVVIARLMRDKQKERAKAREAQALVDGQERERARIGKDLHDSIGSLLSTIKIQLSGLECRTYEEWAKQRQQYARTQAMLDQAVEEVRRISHDLVSGVLVNFGLVAALQDLAQSVSNTGKLEMQATFHNFDNRLPSKMELILYRVTQELLTNAQRHGQATRFEVSLQRYENELVLMADDNGSGFNPEVQSEGIGIRNIRQRLEQVKGQLRFDSHPKRGTTAIVTVPMQAISESEGKEIS